MTPDTQIQTIEKLVEPLLQDDMFLVYIKVKPTNNIKIFLDADSGLGIEKCIRINRALYKVIEELGLYPDGNFSLEVSSPGIDEPLKLTRQFRKNVGREVEVVLNDESKITGKMVSVTDDRIEIETVEGKGKKAVTKNTGIGFDEIKTAIVQVKF